MTFYIIILTLFFKGGLVETKAVQCWDTKVSCDMNAYLMSRNYTSGVFKIESTDMPITEVQVDVMKKFAGV